MFLVRNGLEHNRCRSGGPEEGRDERVQTRDPISMPETELCSHDSSSHPVHPRPPRSQHKLMVVSDEGCNPFYCSIDAATFLHNLRIGLALHPRSQDHHLRYSFASCLLRECGDLEFLASGADVRVATERNLPAPYLHAPKLPLIPTQADDFLMTHNDRFWIPVSSPSPPTSPFTSSSIDARQKLLGDYSDLNGASLWAKSSDAVNCGSFELSGKADKIEFSAPGLVYSPVDPILDRYRPQETSDNLVARVQELEGLFSDRPWFSS